MRLCHLLDGHDFTEYPEQGKAGAMIGIRTDTSLGGSVKRFVTGHSAVERPWCSQMEGLEYGLAP